MFPNPIKSLTQLINNTQGKHLLGFPLSNDVQVFKIPKTNKFLLHNTRTNQAVMLYLAPQTNPKDVLPAEIHRGQVGLYDQRTTDKWIVRMPPPPPKSDPLTHSHYIVKVGDHSFRYPTLLMESAFPTIRQRIIASLPNKLDFPDRNPEDWVLLLSFVGPANKRYQNLTEHNVQVLLPWFHDMGMTWMMHGSLLTNV
mmetsp:Transcript_18646/g.31839  ORF Transcript_18646/g.31839 Transcript_18646/m.31839 type:complete len:197 (-) Transcript_18646:2-592(-)